MRILWNRDMNACVNMLNLFLFDDQPISHADMDKFNSNTPAADKEGSDTDVPSQI